METYVLYKYACLGLLVITAFMFSKDLIYYLFGVYDVENHNNRLKQLSNTTDRLKVENKKEEEIKQTRELVEKITAPIIRHIMPNISSKKDLSTLEKNLHFAGFDKYVSPVQYVALILFGRLVGVTLFVVLMPYNLFLAIMWLSGPALLPTLLFKNTINNKKEKILLGFPDFIKISKSYLVSGMPFEKAVEECILYVNEEWQELLKKYLINSESYSKKECLTILGEECNSFEVKEFVSIVKLNLEQGIDIKDSFDSQYDKIKDLQKIVVQKKIESRKIWTILVQAPVLLTILIAFGLPIVESMLGFGGGF